MTKVIDPNFETFGWKTHVRERRGSFKITINNLIAVGAGLKHGQPLYCYVAKDKDGRTLIVIYPDGKSRKML